MINKELRDYLNNYDSSFLIFDNPSFDNSIIGISQDEKLIYSFEKMVDELAQDDNISLDDAVEFIEYNTIRTIPYMGKDAPIISYDIML